MRGLSTIAVAALLGVAPKPIHADDTQVDEAAVRARVAQELRCLDAAWGQLDETIRLLRQAHEQMRSSQGPAVRRDAARAAESLEQRIRKLSRDLGRCVAHAPKPPQETAEERPADPAERAVARENPTITVIERDRRLGPYVSVKVGQQVDGTGSVPKEALRDAVGDLARPLHRCYERLVARGALERGGLTLLFRVSTRGRVSRVTVEEGHLGNRAFARCVTAQARRNLRVTRPAVGGHADFSYELHFGPDSP